MSKFSSRFSELGKISPLSTLLLYLLLKLFWQYIESLLLGQREGYTWVSLIIESVQVNNHQVVDYCYTTLQQTNIAAVSHAHNTINLSDSTSTDVIKGKYRRL